MKQKKSLTGLLSQLELNEAVFFKNKEGGYSLPLHFDVEKKLELISPDAIYVFNKQPLILFFDLTADDSKDREDDIHRKVWSFDNSPIAFVIKKTEIKVYNALNYIKQDGRLQELTLTESEITERFSFWNIQSNNLWKWFQEKYIETERTKKYKKRVNDRLFENIKAVRNALIDKENDPEGSIPNSLILRLIFIRYLIDRKIEIGSEFISGQDVISKKQCFSKLLQDPDKLHQLFAKLNDRFNGVLFKDIDIKLTPDQAEGLSSIFSGEEPEKGTLFYGNDYYFEIFDFSIIPVEVISGIYESLIDPETRDLQSAVYTPSFLVEYILNDTVDIFLEENTTSECKIFEVAVGSGIFLVQSLRRMIEKEIELNGKSNKRAFSERIREIVKKNLYGVDINKEALKVTCFSIYIALLDYQEPKDIDKYLFPTLLGENLFEADFFNVEFLEESIISKIKFDYILGNPPWRKDNSKKHLEWINTNRIYKRKVTERLEIAQSFLLRAKDFMQPNTKAALIVTSTMFYNVSKTTKQFKKEFLSTYCIDKFFDLSPVRHLIFEEKDSPASIVYYKLSQNEDYLSNIINHQSVKFNYFLKHFKMLVIEKFDQNKISQNLFIKHDWMFKVALYGNTLDYCLLEKITKNATKLKDIIDNKNVLIKGSGIKEKPISGSFPFLIGKTLLENEEVLPYFTNKERGRKLTEEDVVLQSGRRKILFEGNQILLKAQTESESDIVVSYTEVPVVFKHDVFGISSSKQKEKLLEIYALFISNLHTYYQFLSNCSWGIATRPAIRLEEYLSFPYIETSNSILQKELSLVSKFIQKYEDFHKEFQLGEPKRDELLLEEINSIIDDLYNINGYEKDLIDYVLNISRYQFQASKQRLITDFTEGDEKHYRSKKRVLKEYAEIYLQEFEDVYADEDIQVEIYPLKHFIAMNFVFCKEALNDKIIYPKDKLNIADVLKRLGNLGISQITNTTDPTKNLFIQKDIKGFEENSFYIIKPNEYKCWHRAMAWYDIAEFKDKIGKAELEYLNIKEDE